MASLGGYLILFGVGSGLLSFFDYELSLLMWVGSWGDGFAWLIRGAFILTGMALISREANKRQTAEQPPVPQSPIS